VRAGAGVCVRVRFMCVWVVAALTLKNRFFYSHHNTCAFISVRFRAPVFYQTLHAGNRQKFVSNK